MRKMLGTFAGLIVVVLGVIGGVLVFDAPVKPPPLDSISKPFIGLDFSGCRRYGPMLRATAPSLVIGSMRAGPASGSADLRLVG